MLSVLFVGDAVAGAPVLRRMQALDGARLCGIVSEEPNAVRVAEIHGVPLLKTAELNSADTLQVVADMEPDLCISFNSTVIFSDALLALPRLGSINCHPGPLPEYAGLFVFQWAIINGETEFGVTVHYMEKDIDTGPIIAIHRFPLSPEATGLSFYIETLKHCAKLLGDVVTRFATGEIPAAHDQDLRRRRYYDRRPPHGGKVDFHWSSRQVADFVRALNYRPLTSPSGPPMTSWNGIPVELVSAEILPGAASGPAGKVLALNDDGIVVGTGDGAVNITRVFVDGKVTTAGGISVLAGIRLGDRFEN